MRRYCNAAVRYETAFQKWADDEERQAKYAYARLMSARMNMSNIAKLIAAGGDPDDSPWKDDYHYLIDEYGENVFEDEINNMYLIK